MIIGLLKCSSKVVTSDSSKVEMSDVPYATPLGMANGSGFGSIWNNYDEYGRTRPAQGGASLGRRLIEAWHCCAQAGAYSMSGTRLVMRYRTGSSSGLVSRRRNRPSNNQIDDEIGQIALTIIRERYADFGPTLACEDAT